MMRFFAIKKEGNIFTFSKETLLHLKVARIKNEKIICLFEEKFYICHFKDNVAIIESELKENHEYENPVIIASAIINTKRFEWLIQKATELGATDLYPIYTENVEQKLGNDIQKKVERWNEIAKNSTLQSFRNKIMKVHNPVKFKEILNLKVKNKFIAHEKEKATNYQYFFPQDSIFLIGPEGGFSNNEIKEAKEHNFEPISLGKRILRAETAPLLILSRIKENI
ncbi:16S rRNA (uracil(1498)-N(3))-methyltransferase [Mesomycoplasma molare]|uniref:Ribosomal RNA small subunit methyltransferase E n=1 Tax=Mesomycoplasma molare TaxID=171288 RepID=A0ABY5TU09_9BACT|nr:16S rRNA (uracil(1498)-N(3))-methyltransferase [Mesomycoplasma molare]UWD34143.1 16S rRNA (uracil(1498)-N(3))-methyltransferase [Mesomycoplasma molare]